MWEYAGIARTARGLRTALEKLDAIGRRLPGGATEERNMLQTAQLVVEAALLRKESRGGHYRADYPRAKRTWRGRTSSSDGLLKTQKGTAEAQRSQRRSQPRQTGLLRSNSASSARSAVQFFFFLFSVTIPGVRSVQ